MHKKPFSEFLDWDDTILISENPVVNQGVSIDKLVATLDAIALNLWHPITLMSHQLDVQLFGLNPDLHHLSAIFYHLLAGLALYFALYQLSKIKLTYRNTVIGKDDHLQPETQKFQLTKPVAVLTVLLFLVHPMHVESWAWLSERKDTLSAIFGFLSLAYWIKFTGNDSKDPSLATWTRSLKISYGLSLILLILGLLAKPSLIVWPVILLFTSYLLDTLKTRKLLINSFLLLIPHFLVSLVIAGVTYNLQLNRGVDSVAVIATRSLDERLVVGFNNLFIYLYKVIYPEPLSYCYPPLTSYPVVGCVIGVVCCMLFSCLAWFLRKRFRLIIWAWVSFLILLAPVCGFILSGECNAPDRYSYISYTGLLLIIALFFCKLFDFKKNMLWKILMSIILIVSISAMSIYSIQRGLLWRNLETLSSDALIQNPANYIAHQHRSSYYLKMGDAELAKKSMLDSLKYKKNNRYLWARLGWLELNLGNAKSAEKYFIEQLKYNKQEVNSLKGLVRINILAQKNQKALLYLERLIRLEPDNSFYRESMEKIKREIKYN